MLAPYDQPETTDEPEISPEVAAILAAEATRRATWAARAASRGSDAWGQPPATRRATATDALQGVLDPWAATGFPYSTRH